MKKVYWYFVGLYLVAMQQCANDMNQERTSDDIIIMAWSVLSYRFM